MPVIWGWAIAREFRLFPGRPGL